MKDEKLELDAPLPAGPVALSFVGSLLMIASGFSTLDGDGWGTRDSLVTFLFILFQIPLGFSMLVVSIFLTLKWHDEATEPETDKWRRIVAEDAKDAEDAEEVRSELARSLEKDASRSSIENAKRRLRSSIVILVLAAVGGAVGAVRLEEPSPVLLTVLFSYTAWATYLGHQCVYRKYAPPSHVKYYDTSTRRGREINRSFALFMLFAGAVYGVFGGGFYEYARNRALAGRDPE